jgi:uncharacterized Zn-binding protein involved in type VI secretion
MPGISRVGVDAAGGVFTGPGVTSVRVNGAVIVVVGTSIASHGISPHDNAHTVGSSATVRAGGILVCRAGDVASCGHGGTGSSNVSAG